MTTETMIALASGGISVIQLLITIAIIAWISPLRKSAEKIDSLEAKIDQLNIDGVRNEIKQFKARVIGIEERETSCRAALTRDYVSRREWTEDRDEARRTRSKLFEMMEELLQRTAHLVGYGKKGDPQ